MTSISVPPDQENISNNSSLPAKQVGVAKLQSTTKKKALADVGNTVHQRCPPKGSESKNQLVHKPSMPRSHDTSVKNDVSNTICSSKKNLDHENVHVCSCPEQNEQDDYADILFKNIRLSKNQIEYLAMEWEHAPKLNKDDKREFDFPEAASIDIDYDMIAMNWSSKQGIILEDFEVPPPELDDILDSMAF